MVYQAAEPERLYTKAELLEAAHAAGFTGTTGRLLADWVTIGLLDQSHRRGLGRGKGTEAGWPETQLRLFLTLLEKRTQVKQIATLCNIPVALWLWWDQYVPLRQTNRALATWVGKYERVSWRRARWTADQLVEQFAHPEAKASDRRELVDEIAHTAYGKPFQPDRLLTLFRPVFDPNGVGRVVGPPGLSFRPEHFVFLTEVRLNAVAALREQSLDDAAYLWARDEYRQSRREFEQQVVPLFAANPEAADMFLKKTEAGLVLPPTLEELVNQACVDLLTLLGIHLSYRSQSKE